MATKAVMPFQQLLTVVKSPTPAQKAALKQELEDKQPIAGSKAEFVEMLLNGPIYSAKQIKSIKQNRKSIAKWRTKS